MNFSEPHIWIIIIEDSSQCVVVIWPIKRTHQLLTVNAPWGKLEHRVWHLWRIQLPHLPEARTVKHVLHVNHLHLFLSLRINTVCSAIFYELSVTGVLYYDYSPCIQVVDQVWCQERMPVDLKHNQKKNKFDVFYEQTFLLYPLIIIIRTSTAKKNREIIQIITSNRGD